MNNNLANVRVDKQGERMTSWSYPSVLTHDNQLPTTNCEKVLAERHISIIIISSHGTNNI